MSLIAAKLLETEDFEQMIGMVGMYMVTVISGLAIHAFILLPLIYVIVTRKNPYTFLLGVLQAIVTAVGTASRYYVTRITSHGEKKDRLPCPYY